MIAGTVTLGTSQRRIGWYPRRRSAVYVTKPTRIGGITKNHFCVLSGMRVAPFGESHRSEMTSRIEYKDDVKMSATLRRPQEKRRYQSGTMSSEIWGLRAGPRNGVR